MKVYKTLFGFTCLLLLLSGQLLMAHEGHKKAKKDTLVSVQKSDPSGHRNTMEQSPSLEAFPNLHPLIVHFPIVLLILAASMQLAGLFFNSRSYHISIAILAALGFVGAFLASSSFHGHPSELNGPLRDLFEEHEYWAFWAVRLGGMGAAIKIITVLAKPTKWLQVTAALVLLGAAIAVSVSGHHGAELVHKHGLGAKGYLLEKHNH